MLWPEARSVFACQAVRLSPYLFQKGPFLAVSLKLDYLRVETDKVLEKAVADVLELALCQAIRGTISLLTDDLVLMGQQVW